MQLKFVFSVAIVVACFSQVSTDSTTVSATTEVQGGNIGNLIKFAGKLIGQLIKFITGSISLGVKVFTAIISDAIKLAKFSINTTIKTFKIIINTARAGFVGTIKKAVELGIDITVCLGESSRHFRKLLSTLITEEAKCVTKEINKIKSKVSDSITIIKNAGASVIQLPGKLNGCIHGLSQVSCILDLIQETIKAQTTLPRLITNTIKEAVEIFGGSEIKIGICAVKHFAKAGAQVALTVADFGSCAIIHGI